MLEYLVYAQIEEDAMKRFDFTIDIHGACFVACSERLSTALSSPDSVEREAKELKVEIDRTAKRMKTAIAKARSKPLFEH